MASARPAVRWAMAANVYISEGRSRELVTRLSGLGAAAGVVVANEFLDVAYHRAGITFASTDAGRLEAAIIAVSREALLALDLRGHTASHPRVGVVDHISCSPLGAATCDEAGRLATRVGSSLGRGEPGVWPAVPVYYYGFAREDARPLAKLRRSLGYFGGAVRGEWTGLSDKMLVAMRELPADTGPPDVNPIHGVAVVGAVPWVTNYNILLTRQEADTYDEAELMTRCRRIAKSTSTRGGGPPAVETMALPHEHGVEVACNLLDTSSTPAAEVLRCVGELAKAEDLQLKSDYYTNKLPEEILTIAERADQAATDGGDLKRRRS